VTLSQKLLQEHCTETDVLLYRTCNLAARLADTRRKYITDCSVSLLTENGTQSSRHFAHPFYNFTAMKSPTFCLDFRACCLCNGAAYLKSQANLLSSDLFLPNSVTVWVTQLFEIRSQVWDLLKHWSSLIDELL